MSEGNDQVRADKRALRARLLAARRERGAAERDRVGVAIRDVLMEPPWTAKGRTVACYYSVGGEPDTRGLVHALWRRGTSVLLPVFLPDGTLDWSPYQGPGHLVPTGHGLLEPSGHRYGTRAPGWVDAVICPALAVDHEGIRMGRGAGCYDRALAHKRPRTPAIAVVHDEEFVEALPSEPHDLPVDAVVTPGGGLRSFVPGPIAGLGDGPDHQGRRR